jgi:hypothetical protein
MKSRKFGIQALANVEVITTSIKQDAIAKNISFESSKI